MIPIIINDPTLITMIAQTGKESSVLSSGFSIDHLKICANPCISTTERYRLLQVKY